MAKLTRGGVCLDLRVSPFNVTNHYQATNQNITFAFSSELHRVRFLERMDDHRDKIEKSLSNRFGYSVKNNVIADIQLYQMIETRGFLIQLDGDSITCLSNITLDGSLMMNKG